MMSKNKIAFACGCLLILLQLTGFPYYVNKIAYIIIGAILILLAVTNHFKRRTREFDQPYAHPEGSFTEHRGPNSIESE